MSATLWGPTPRLNRVEGIGLNDEQGIFLEMLAFARLG